MSPVDTTVAPAPAPTGSLSSKASNGLSPLSPHPETIVSSEGEGSVASPASPKTVSEFTRTLRHILISIVAEEKNQEAEVIRYHIYSIPVIYIYVFDDPQVVVTSHSVMELPFLKRTSIICMKATRIETTK